MAKIVNMPGEEVVRMRAEIAAYRKALRFAISSILTYAPDEHDGGCSSNDEDDLENCDCGLVWVQNDIKFLRRVLRTRGAK